MKIILILILGVSLNSFAQEEFTVGEIPEQVSKDIEVARTTMEDRMKTDEFKERREKILKKVRRTLISNIHADCFGREISEKELEGVDSMTQEQVFELGRSAECQTEEARQRRRERRERAIAEFEARPQSEVDVSNLNQRVFKLRDPSSEISSSVGGTR